MADINIYGTLTNVTGEPIASAEQIGDGDFYQSEINEHLMQGEIYDPLADSGKGAWVSNTSDPTEATTDKLGGIKVAYVRELHNTQTIQGGTDNVIGRLYGVELDKDGKAFVHVPWVQYALGTASNDILGGVMTGADTGIKVEEQVIKADFDTTDYSKVEDITKYDFSNTKAKVASPYVVNEILKKAIYDVLNSEY